MNLKKSSIAASVIIMGLVGPLSANAGIYTDDLSRCMIESTSKKDREILVKWMFSSASLHPAAQSITSVSDQEREQANKATAELVMRLLTESCELEAKKALQYEGGLALPTSFRVLGEIAGQEMFSNPEVSASMSNIAKYLDEEKLKALLAP